MQRTAIQREKKSRRLRLTDGFLFFGRNFFVASKFSRSQTGCPASRRRSRNTVERNTDRREKKYRFLLTDILNVRQKYINTNFKFTYILSLFSICIFLRKIYKKKIIKLKRPFF